MLIKKILTISNTIRYGKTLALKKTCRASFLPQNYYCFSQNKQPKQEENDQKLLLDCLRKIKEQHLTQRRKVLMTELTNKKGMLSTEENSNILKELADIKKEELSLRT